MIRALLWKEWRNSVKLLLALGLGAVAAVGIGALSATSSGTIITRYWQGVMDGVAILFPLAAAALFGANAFAGERTQHAELFLDSLPVGKLSAGLLKVSFSLLLLLLLNIFLWLWVEPTRRFLLHFAKAPSLWLTFLSPQVLVFGLCFLASALSDRPIRALLRAPLLAFFVVWPLAGAGLSLLVLAAAHSPETRPDSFFDIQSLFDGAVILAGFLMLGIPFLIERWKPHRGRGLILAVLLGFPVVLMLLPALQFYRLWGQPGFHQLLGAFDPGERVWVWAAGLGAWMVMAALILEARNWPGRGIGVVWAGTASLSWVAGGCLLIGWVATVLGLFGQFRLPEAGIGACLVPTPDGKSLIAVGTKVANWADNTSMSPLSYCKSDAVLLSFATKEALRLPAPMKSSGFWSPDGHQMAWGSGDYSYLLGEIWTGLCVLDTRTSTVRVARIAPGNWIQEVKWKPDSMSLVSVAADEFDPPQLLTGQRFKVRVDGFSITHGRLRTRRIAKWEAVPSELDYYQPWPRALAIEGTDILLYLEPQRWYPARRDLRVAVPDSPPHSPAFGLFRIDAKSGRVRPDPAFERLRCTLEHSFPPDRARGGWSMRPFRPWDEPINMGLMEVTGYDAATKTPWSQIWRLGQGDEPDRLLLDEQEGDTESARFLDDQAFVFARRTGNERKADCEWEVIRRTIFPKGDILLAKVPLSHRVSITPSPSRKRLVVESYPPRHSWFVTREGAVSQPLDEEFCRYHLLGEWSPDESKVLAWGDDLCVVDITWDIVRPTCSIRRISDFKEHPEYRLEYDRLFDGTACYGFTEKGRRERNWEVRLCRIDLKTGKPEILLRFDGDRWVGCGGVTVKEAKVK